jgi:hypothetical protein
MIEGPAKDMVAADADTADMGVGAVGEEITDEGSMPIIKEDIKE